jgi:tight adherence protein B
MNITMILIVGLLLLVAVGGGAFAFAGASSEQSKKRINALVETKLPVKPNDGGNPQRRKSVQTALKDLEKQQRANAKKRPDLHRRIEQAGLSFKPQTYWIWSAGAGVLGALVAFLSVRVFYAVPLAAFGCMFGLPRWVLTFLKNRREKAFTKEFAPAIDTIVRSVKTGLPVNEALKLVANEIPEPVAGEFRVLIESLKLGVPMEDALKRMYERMPTAEVNFFGTVMAIQQKAGGNLSEALGNLAGVLRERKRLQGKIKALSSEAKTGAMIIGSLPPGVMLIVYVTTPDYIKPLFTTPTGNLLLFGCAIWMSIGILVMKKMISFKY